MAFPTLFTIESLGIPHAQVLKSLLQSLFGPRDGDEMVLIGHQALGENLNPEYRSVRG